MNVSQRILTPLLALTFAVPLAVSAQTPATPPAQIRNVTVSRFAFADETLEHRMATMWFDSVIVPTTRMDPNVTSMKIATHNWGSNSRDVVVISEYAT